jgi:hypothetical protein
MVFVRSADEDRCGGFTQPFLLCLVTGIEGEGGADESIDHDDVLSVQYMTASKYTANYTPVIMADADSRANKCKKKLGVDWVYRTWQSKWGLHQREKRLLRFHLRSAGVYQKNTHTSQTKKARASCKPMRMQSTMTISEVESFC